MNECLKKLYNLNVLPQIWISVVSLGIYNFDVFHNSIIKQLILLPNLKMWCVMYWLPLQVVKKHQLEYAGLA